MRYIYFLLINFCSGHTVIRTGAHGAYMIETWDGNRYFVVPELPFIERLVSKMDNRRRPFDDIAPVNIRNCLFQQHTGLPFLS